MVHVWNLIEFPLTAEKKRIKILHNVVNVYNVHVPLCINLITEQYSNSYETDTESVSMATTSFEARQDGMIKKWNFVLLNILALQFYIFLKIYFYEGVARLDGTFWTMYMY